MNRLTGEQDGGQANGWGHSVSQTEFLVLFLVDERIHIPL